MAGEDSRVGTIIASKYRLDEELGRGGMGAVYRVFHLRVHKVFALKMLLGEVAKHRSIASRFLLEAQAAGRIGHPGILDVYDVGEDADGTPFLVMELLRGEALSTLIRRERIEVDAALWIAMEVLDILSAAHRAGIIHRDVKPQNVFVTEHGETRGVKLLDFGIAKFSGVAADGSALTRSGEIIGSPLYMAPEQAKGEPDLDDRADVWSVGAMLFEMLTGTCAHAATTPVAVLAKILTETAPPASSKNPSVPVEADAIVAKALRIDRSERWPDAKTMRDALAEARASLGHSGPPSLPKPQRPSVAPLSTDRTPGAITSTLMQSDPPPAPSHPPESVAATEQQHAAQGTTVPTRNQRSPLVTVAAVALATGALFVIGKQLQTPPPAPPSVPAAVQAPSAPPAPLPPVSAEPVVSASPAPVVADAGKPAPVAAPAPPKCAPGEVVSNGHCCARGLEWQNGRCERPIATTF
ncbi:MAG: serine/threonine-protein kinase [Labilithrix sp.]